MKQLLSLTLALSFSAGLAVAAEPEFVPLDLFATAGDLEVTLWAKSPMLKNPTNMDVDRDGRIWVAEGVNYRQHYNRQPEGDRIVVLEDTDGDGSADQNWTFVQDEALHAPMGIAVLDNQIVVSMAPDLIIYTDVDRNMKFDPSVDKREVLLTGFIGHSHDHSLHSVTFGPDGQWYFNSGNCGALVTDHSGTTYRIGSPYRPGNVGGMPLVHDPLELAGQESDDGHVYVGGVAYRMNPDGTGLKVIGQNFRNSYEQSVTSFGDVFHSDNDDPPACRVTFLMEHGNMGFASFDGQRGWGADRRPGQSTQIAEWRQEDPGTLPAGDVYGGGSPTGVAFYENGALGEEHRGLLLTCEPGRNVVFGYHPEAQGAGYQLERFNFVTANIEEEFAGADFKGGGRSVTRELKTLFRPSDVLVGADGAIYVSDWFDPRVGGHQDLDDSLSGAIYRIAPKGFKPVNPEFDLETTEGQIAALKSPAVNVRSLGFTRLVEQGSAAIPAVRELLNDDNPYIRARAIWLLSQLGPVGVQQVETLLTNADDLVRVTAYRALRRQNHEFLATSKQMAEDRSPAVRREVALAMRDVPFDQSRDILMAVAKQYDGQDPWYLEAIGTGATKKESRLYDLLRAELAANDSLEWSDAFADFAWRLHPPQSAPGLARRALAVSLPLETRKAAVVALAYIGTQEAVMGIVDAAEQAGGPVQAEAMWWLLHRKGNEWQEYGLDEELKKRGLYDPESVEIVEVLVPEPPESKLPSIAEIQQMEGDIQRGKLISTACLMCHKIEGEGAEFGPDITAFARLQPDDVIVRSIINPSESISHGYDGREVVLKDGTRIHGVILARGNPTVVSSQGGVTQMIPEDRVSEIRDLNRSLMLSAEQMGLGPQEVADLLAYMKSLR